MSTPSALLTPDFNQAAADFDRFLPQIHPVTLALLDHLPMPAPGATVLDVACGTGEPGLTLARRAPQVRLLGVDSADAMITIARAKADREQLTNTHFEVMPFETLAVADASVDSVISRFGLMMFGDVPTSARELGRVLRVGGNFSLAVWDDMTKNTLVHSLVQALRDYLPKDSALPTDRLTEWAAEGLRTRLLQEAGLREVQSEMFSWQYNFDSFEHAYSLVSLPGMFGRQLAALPPEAPQKIKRAVQNSLAAYQKDSGGYVIPHACRLIWGQR